MESVRGVEDKIEEALHLNHPGHVHGGGGTLAEDLREGTATGAKNAIETPVTRDSDHTLAEPEKDRAANSYAPSDRMSVEDPERSNYFGVNVHNAEKEFAELQRQLTGLSQASRKLSRTQSRRSNVKGTAAGGQDVEKAIPSSQEGDEAEPFDLEDTLRGNKQLEDEAGIKSKHIGVIWNNLSVKGIGGNKNFVETFPDAFTNFFLFPYRTLVDAFGWGKKGKEFEILKGFRGVTKPGEMVLVLGRPGSGCTTFLKVRGSYCTARWRVS